MSLVKMSRMTRARLMMPIMHLRESSKRKKVILLLLMHYILKPQSMTLMLLRMKRH